MTAQLFACWIFSCFFVICWFYFKPTILKELSLCQKLDPDQAWHFVQPGPEFIKLFPCSTLLHRKLIQLINVKMSKIVGILTFNSIINTTSERLKSKKLLRLLVFLFLRVEISCSVELSMKKVLWPLGLVWVETVCKSKHQPAWAGRVSVSSWYTWLELPRNSITDNILHDINTVD